ncbi:MAG: polyphosphate kinase 1 [Chloroherpetonaceae bacterium]|nr:polyphosphate kinase 1 [Chloroherpetonaceae bacterium]MDW8437250.1 polyphosphate kinase 1 [Chloroherpetonaceae bacterium]
MTRPRKPRRKAHLSETPVLDATASAVDSNFNDSRLYINRELSWIEFNLRVLDEARCEAHPLLERLKFIAIFSSNLDEFFMIRVSAVEEQVEAGIQTPSLDGLTPMEQLLEIRKRVEQMLHERNDCFYNDILPKLAAANIHFKKCAELSAEQRAALDLYFENNVFPILTPLALDPGHPFPHVSNLSLSLAVQLQAEGDDEPRFARVKVPDTIPRLIRLDKIGVKLPKGETIFVWLEDVIATNIQKLFPDVEIQAVYPFRVIRDADIEIEEDEAGDLLETIEQGLRQRRYGNVVRLDVNPGMPPYIKQVLIENLGVSDRQVYEIPGALGLASLMEAMSLERPDLKDSPFIPRNPFLNDEGDDIFSIIRKRDVLLHHPYDSFQPVVDLISEAANDPNVLAIKQTLYRVGSKSPIVQALIEAAERGKQVAVLVELKARFDEENNITWAKALEKAGAHVVYGLIGLKTHAKVLLIVRNENGELRRYVHLGTGNYNPSTAKIYTDYSLFTCNKEIGADVSEVFNYLTGYSRQKDYRKIFVAPLGIRKKMLELIEREIDHHKRRQNGRIIMKMNALVDEQIIRALYRASQEGVRIDLIVRGICVLRPELKGVSENIRVVSVVGRFLEHSRAYYFFNDGDEEIYLSSADMMRRNLDRRVEILFPILDPAHRKQIKRDLELILKDNLKARKLNPDGSYEFVTTNGKPLNSQLAFLRERASKVGADLSSTQT